MTVVGLLFPPVPDVVQLPVGERVAVALTLVVPTVQAATVVVVPGEETEATAGLDEVQPTEETVPPQESVMVTLEDKPPVWPAIKVRAEGEIPMVQLAKQTQTLLLQV